MCALIQSKCGGRRKKQSCHKDNIGHEIRLSSESQEFLVAMQVLRDLPEVDEERVALLRQQIEAGTYQVDSKRIALSMLTGHHLDEQV